MTFDVAIVGGGVAGVASALSLRHQIPNARVAIFDAGRRTLWRPGETLSPIARPLLESLGCWPRLQQSITAGETLESFGIESVWGSEEAQANEFLLSRHGNGWRLDRAKFDAMLLEHAQDTGVTVHRDSTLVGSTELDHGWRLEFAAEAVEASFVIDASGRAARFAVERGVRMETADSLAGVFVLFDCRNGEAYDPLIEARENGWWYSTSVPGGTLVVGWMSDTDLIRTMKLKDAVHWHALLEASKETRRRTARAMASSGPMIFAAQSRRLNKVAGRGWAAAGDAAMAFDPLSSHGITKALRSGKLASFVARDWLSNGEDTHERYCGIEAAEWTQYDTARHDYYAQERRWPDSVFWARRHGAGAK